MALVIGARPHRLGILELLLDTPEFIYFDLRRLLPDERVAAVVEDPIVFPQFVLLGQVLRWHGGIEVTCAEIIQRLPLTHDQGLKETIQRGKVEPLARAIAETNNSYFLPQFTYPLSKFEVATGKNEELADHLVLVKGRGLLFQLKEQSSKSKLSVGRWIMNSVMGKAKKQIKNSHRLLKDCSEIVLTNSRGRNVVIKPGHIREMHYIICYRAFSDKTDGSNLPRRVESETAGFVHVFSVQEYSFILSTLVTYSELLEYLNFRRSMFNRWSCEGLLPGERALVGQFIAYDDNARPDDKYGEILDDLDRSKTEFDLSFLLKDFERDAPDFSEERVEQYSEFLSEFAMLNRSELHACRARIQKCLDYRMNNSEDFECYRFKTIDTGVCFLFVGFGKDEVQDVQRCFLNLACACKYDTRAERQVAVGVWSDGSAINFRWCLIGGSWEYSESIEKMLAESNPFRRMQEKAMPRYKAASQEKEKGEP